MHIHDMQIEAHKTAREKGWWEGTINIPEKLCLIHSEISEALECYRDGKLAPRSVDGKPEGLVIELADVVIRIADLCSQLGFNLEYALETKMKYNKTRPYRHGGKKA